MSGARLGCVVAFVMALVAGCGGEDVVVAEIAPSGDAGDGSTEVPPGASCTTNFDCPPNAFCAKSACDAKTGGCELRPVLCDGDARPTCGCDGVTYWNDCVRKRSGAAASTMGECAVGKPCDDDGRSCGVPGASCARLVPPQAPCPPMFPGACWMLPDECPPPMGMQPEPPMPTYRECGPAGACSSACDAIRSGAPHQATPRPGCM